MSDTNDGSTAEYYKLPLGATELYHLIIERNMNGQMSEIFRACYRYGRVDHSSKLRDARKIKAYAEQEIERLEKYESGPDGDEVLSTEARIIEDSLPKIWDAPVNPAPRFEDFLREQEWEDPVDDFADKIWDISPHYCVAEEELSLGPEGVHRKRNPSSFLPAGHDDL